MNWFNDAKNEAEAVRSRSESIYQESEKIYNLLWGAITKETMTLQSQQHLSILTAGSTFERILRHQVLPSGEAHRNTLREMHITLSADKKCIIAIAPRLGDYGPSSVTFDFETLEDGVVHLMHEGATIEIQAAAIMVLRNFLFPNLPLKRD
jgi:hypothetical protein